MQHSDLPSDQTPATLPADPSRTLTMCSCGKKNCPEITENLDGSFTLSDPDVAGCGPIVLNREQAAELQAWLARRIG